MEPSTDPSSGDAVAERLFGAVLGTVDIERPDELVLAEADMDEQTVLDVVQLAHRHGVQVKLAPTTTELLVHEGRYVPGQGVPLFELRPPMLSGVAWATKRAFDLLVAFVVVRW